MGINFAVFSSGDHHSEQGRNRTTNTTMNKYVFVTACLPISGDKSFLESQYEIFTCNLDFLLQACTDSGANY